MPSPLPLHDAYALWDHVRQYQWALLDRPGLSHLHTLWLSVTGVLRARGEPLAMGSPRFDHFGWWVAARAGNGLDTGGWQYFLSLGCTDEEGAVRFFEALDQFRGRRLVPIAEARPDPQLPPYQILSYLPEEACFLETRSPDRLGPEWVWTRERGIQIARERLGILPDAWKPISSSPETVAPG